MATKTKTPLEALANVKSLTPIKNNTKVTGREKVAVKATEKVADPTPAKPDYLSMKAGERNAHILERSREVVNALRGVGLQAVAYDRAPIAPLVFTMGLDTNAEVYRFWVGNADVEIIQAVSEPKRQAVIRVREDAHKIVHKFKRNAFIHETYIRQGEDAIRERYAPSAESIITTTFPTGTKLSIRKLEWKKLAVETRGGTNAVWTGEVHISVPKFDNHYLIGYDENKCFISQLPKPVKTVAEAIKALTPTGLIKGHVRQGEWFFNPCSKAEISTIEAHIKHLAKTTRAWNYAHGNTIPRFDYSRAKPTYPELEIGSSHRAEYQVIINGTQYVKGNVIDSRQGRHAKIVLDDWHRVIRNNEVAQTQTSQGDRPVRSTRWD